MRDSGVMVDGDSERLSSLARLISELSLAMDDQSMFHDGERMAFSVKNLREGAAFAAQRASKAVIAGPRWLLEIEKSILVELTRGALLAAAALKEAASEGWPDLDEKAGEARAAIRAAANRNPALMSPIGLASEEITAASGKSPFDSLPGWRDLGEGRYAALGDEGVVISAISMKTDTGTETWVARVGGVGVAICGDPEEAAASACEAYRAIFSAAVIPDLVP